ncbi:amino acid adenylation domain-containing protein [Nocardia sp. NPDC051321]|uniref:amino acid adenylation domain-containing protein n=1 Tax=Nocardia sp. NPDC051321 TaxID=3364323 RepID=UPI00378EC08C
MSESQECRNSMPHEVSATHATTRPHCAHMSFEQQVLRSPNSIAIRTYDADVTYAELDAYANQFAHYFKSVGVGPETVVAVLLDRSITMIAAFLGVWKSGGAYLPIDPTSPPARVANLVDNARAQLILTEKNYLNAMPAGVSTVVMGQDDESISSQPVEPLVSEVNLNGLAYIIFTSGSTGVPKGVQITHAGLANYLSMATASYPSEGLGAPLFSSVAFDMVVPTLYVPLLMGHPVHVAPSGLQPDKLGQWLLDHGPFDFIKLTPSHLEMLTSQISRTAISGLASTLVVGGEALRTEIAERWSKVARVFNEYGPTEVTVGNAVFQVADHHGASAGTTVPIGRPIAGTSAYILDSDLRSVPEGAFGELYIGGVGLARGYAHRSALTAERFVADPYAQPGARMYRTGDVARALPSGDLEFCGRADNQVKIRGYRVEPGDIQAALLAHPEVRGAAVAVRGDAMMSQVLIAWVGLAPQSQCTAAELREHLFSTIPPYMVPGRIVVVDQIPLTTNGKIDYAALPEPGRGNRDLDSAFAAPITALQGTLAALCSEILNVDPIGLYDNIFELGGHSLLATRIIANINSMLDIDVPVAAIFEQPTIAGLTTWIENYNHHEHSPDDRGPVCEKRNRHERIPLSTAQEQTWILSKIQPSSIAYQTQAYLEVNGQLSPAVLEDSLTEIVRRHEHLRTAFLEIDGKPSHVVRPPFQVTVPVVDLAGEPELIRESLALSLMEDYITQSIDVTSPPLFRWVLFTLAPARHLLLLIEHHFIHDGWSFGRLLGELQDIYSAFAKGERHALPELPIQFADYALWQRRWLQGDEQRRQLAYWQDTLRGAPELLPLPTDQPRPGRQTSHGDTVRIHIAGDTYRRLRKIGAEEQSTGFMTMLAVFFALMHTWSGSEDICVASSIANRRYRTTEPLLGMLINNVVMRVKIEDGYTFRDLLQQTAKTAIGAYRNQDLPFPKLVEQLNPKRDLSYNPLYQVAFSYHDARVPQMSLGDATAEVHYLTNGTAKHDLDVIVIPRSEQLSVESGGDQNADVLMLWTYSTDLFERASIVRMASDFTAIVEQAILNPDLSIPALVREIARSQ